MVSVIIPTYNRAEYVTQAIDSVLAQSYTHYELIVVDDGSTDDTRDILQTRYSGRIRYLYQRNKGPSAARNSGIRAARYDLLAFLDSDDLWFPQKLEIQVPLMADEGIVLSYTNSIENEGASYEECLKVVGGQDRFSQIGVYFGEEPSIVNCPLDLLLRKGGSGIFTPFVMCRREAVERVGGFDERMDIAEDIRLWLRLAFEGRFVVTSRPLGCRRWPGSGKQLTDPDRISYYKNSANLRTEIFMECYARAIDQPPGVQRRLRQFIADSLAGQAKHSALEGNYSVARRRAFECLAFSPRGKTIAKALVGWLLPQLFSIHAKHRNEAKLVPATGREP
jgi:glycosyltransferase involved in cell wall biosynthesis